MYNNIYAGLDNILLPSYLYRTNINYYVVLLNILYICMYIAVKKIGYFVAIRFLYF